MTCEMYEDHQGLGMIVLGRPSPNHTRCWEPAHYRVTVKLNAEQQVCLSVCIEHGLLTRYPLEMFKRQNPTAQIPADYGWGEVVWIASLPHAVIKSNAARYELSALAAS